MGLSSCGKTTKQKRCKVDDNTTQGIFLRCTATDRNIVYLDLATPNNKKITSNATFDEAHFSTGSPTPGSKALRNSGIGGEISGTNKDSGKIQNKNIIQIKRLHENAKLPNRSNKATAGMDLYTPEDFEIDEN